MSSSRAPGMLLLLVMLGTLLVTLVLTFLPRKPVCIPQRNNPSLRAIGGTLVNAACQPVRLTGVSWFGMETDAFAPQGLQERNWQDMLEQIARAGFTTIRFPFSNQFFEPTSIPEGIDYQKNPDLRGLQGLALLDRLIQGARPVRSVQPPLGWQDFA